MDSVFVKNYWVWLIHSFGRSGKIFTLPSLFAKVLELDYNIPAEALHGGQ